MTASQRAALWQLADVVMRLLTSNAAREAAEEALSWQASHDALTSERFPTVPQERPGKPRSC